MPIVSEQPIEPQPGGSIAEPTHIRRLRRVVLVAAAALIAGGVGAGLTPAFASASKPSSAAGITSRSAKPPAAPRLSNPTATAQMLVIRFFSLVKERNAVGLQSFLSPAFQVERADGTGTAGKAAYLANLPRVLSFRLSSMSGTQDGPVLVARYTVSATGSVNGKPYTPGPAPRLSVFVWNGSAWRLVAHANFNPLNG